MKKLWIGSNEMRTRQVGAVISEYLPIIVAILSLSVYGFLQYGDVAREQGAKLALELAGENAPLGPAKSGSSGLYDPTNNFNNGDDGGDPGEDGAGGSGGSGSGGGEDGNGPGQPGGDFPGDTGNGGGGGEFCEVPDDSGGFPLASNGGLSQPLGMPSTQVGNPINVVTGNKFQKEVDMAALPGNAELSFIRYYNSRSAEYHSGIGFGWRHTYQIVVDHQPAQGVLAVIQANGRRIQFADTKISGIYRGVVSSDGELRYTEGEKLPYRWLRTDGSQLQFGALGQLKQYTASTGENLILRYDDGRLATVEDDRGRMLRFGYYPSGRLGLIKDPSGEEVRLVYDHLGNLASVIGRDGGTRQYHYEQGAWPHHLTGITDERDARHATWRYDAQGRAVLSEHAGGVERVTLEYLAGQTRVTDSRGNTSLYITEKRKGIPVVTEVRGPGCDACGIGDVRYRYNDNLQVTETRHKDGRIIQRDYDAHGRLITKTETTVTLLADQRHHAKTVYHYASDQLLNASDIKPVRIIESSVAEDEQRVTEIAYNAAGQIVKYTESGWASWEGESPRRRSQSFTYNASHQLVTIDGPRQDVADLTTLGYDELGRLNSVTDPVGNTARILAFDPYGRPLRIRSQGVETRVEYTAGDHIAAITRGGRTHRFEYTPSGQLAKRLDPTGQYRLYEYDAAGRLVAITDNQGNTLSNTYDSESRPLSRQFRSADGGVIRTLGWLYDIEGRVAEYQRDAATVQLDYQQQPDHDRLIHFSRANHIAATATFSVFGQLLKLSNPVGDTRYRYDRRDQLARITDAGGHHTDYHYDDFSQLKRVRSRDEGDIRYRYDAAGNLIAVERGDNTITYQYDAANRLVTAISPEGTRRLSYNANNRLAQVQGPNETAHFTYTPTGELRRHTREIDGHRFTTGYDYNESGQLIRKQLANGIALRYTYHQQGPNIGQLEAVKQDRWLWWDSRLISGLHSEGDTSTRQHLTWQSGLTQLTERNPQGRITGISTPGIHGLSLGYDDVGNLLSKRRAANDALYNIDFGYDRAGRLSQVWGQQWGDYNGYVYDAAGNRLSETRTTADPESPAQRYARTGSTDRVIDFAVTQYRYTKGSNQLTKVVHRQGAQSTPEDSQPERPQQALSAHRDYRYTAHGAPTQYDYLVYEYNSHNRPVRAYRGGQLLAEYAYNAWGERIKKIVHQNSQTDTTYYLYEQQRLVAEANGQGEITRRYIYLHDKVVGVWHNDQFYAVHSDQRGAPEAITDERQRLVWQAQLGPWGQAEIDADPDRDGQTFVFHLRLPGQIEDVETGTYYNYQRDYDPRTGRYLTPDPSGQAGGLNTYLYAKANPLRYSDPLGLAPISGIEDQDSSPSLLGSSIAEECDNKDAYDDAILAHSFLNRADGNAAKLLYPTSVEQIRKAWAGENSKKATITTYRPDLQSGNYNLSYDDLTADGIAAFGDLVINATGGAGNSYALSFNSTNTAEIESTLRRHFGKLINNDDVLAVQAALDMTPGALNVIDLTPLHEEIIARFYARLYGDERVIQAEGVVYEVEQRYNQLGLQYGWPSCQTGQSGRNNPSGCSELRSAKSRYESATQAYADVLADVHNEMISQGDLPALDALDGQREEVAELFVTALGIFVPLTLTDLAIDVGTMGLGKIKRIGKAIKAIGDGLGSRLGRMSDEVAKRVLAVRYPHFAQYGELIKHPNLLRYLDEADAGVWDGAVLKRLDDDLANGNLAEALNSNTALLDSWKVLDDAGLENAVRASSSNVTTAHKWLEEGLDQEKLVQALRDAPDAHGLIDDLANARSIYHAQVYVKDFDNIPGVVKGEFSGNGLTAGKSNAEWGDPGLDLPIDEANTFVNAAADELPAGTKLYRVTGGRPDGGYWTLEPPGDVGDVIGGTAVRPEWNSFEKMYVYEVPEGETLRVWRGNAARQRVTKDADNYHLPGGDEQIYIPEKLRSGDFGGLLNETDFL